MRVRRQRRPLLWLLMSLMFTSIATAKSTQSVEPADALAKFPADVADLHDGAISKSSGKAKEIGTKDAPVDGRDGKPHAGPWVGKDAASTKKKAGKKADEAATKDSTVKRLEKEGYGEDSGKGPRVPLKNDGVMDDPNREKAAKGRTGTEGGVSEKSRKEKAKEVKTGEKASKEPEAPKEVPVLPSSEQKRIKASKEEEEAKAGPRDEKKEKEKPKGAIGLEKPADLPDTPRTKAASSSSDEPAARKGAYLVDTMPYTEGQKNPQAARQPVKESVATTDSTSTETEEGLIQPLHSFVLALVMILVSEVGDKTFLVAALMAMRHDRLVVFTAAFSALIAMTVLSALLGHAVPTLLPKRLVTLAAALLFLVFGAKLLREGLAMPRDSGVGEEMREVEAELEEKEAEQLELHRRRSSIMAGAGAEAALEAGRGRSGTTIAGSARKGVSLPPPPESPLSDYGPQLGDDVSRGVSPAGTRGAGGAAASALAGLNNLFSLVLSPAWVQTFVMTFLGEWGDRSQIATIAMAAGPDYWWVIAGALVGHGICTGGAVLGGRALAGRVSMRVVTLGGAAAFILFGFIYLGETAYFSS